MTYNTTFNLGDIVYFLLDNKIRQERIESIFFYEEEIERIFS